MQRLIVFWAAVALCVAAIACGGSDKPEGESTSPAAASPAPTSTPAPSPTPVPPAKAVLQDVTSREYLSAYNGPRLNAKIISAGIDQFAGIGMGDAPAYVTYAEFTKPVRGAVKLDSGERSAWVLFTWKYEGTVVAVGHAAPDERGWAFHQLSPSFLRSITQAPAARFPFGNYELNVAVAGTQETRVLPVYIGLSTGTPVARPAKATFISATMDKPAYTTADKNVGPVVRLSATAWVTETVLYNSMPLFTRSAALLGGPNEPPNRTLADFVLDGPAAGNYQILLTLNETGETRTLDFTVTNPAGTTGPVKIERSGLSSEVATSPDFCKDDPSKVAPKVFSGRRSIFAFAIPSAESPQTWIVARTRSNGLVLPAPYYRQAGPKLPAQVGAGGIPGAYELTITYLSVPPAITTLQYSITSDKAQLAKLLDVGIAPSDWDGCNQPPLLNLGAPVSGAEGVTAPYTRFAVAIKLGPGADHEAKIEWKQNGEFLRTRIEAGNLPYFDADLGADTWTKALSLSVLKGSTAEVTVILPATGETRTLRLNVAP